LLLNKYGKTKEEIKRRNQKKKSKEEIKRRNQKEESKEEIKKKNQREELKRDLKRGTKKVKGGTKKELKEDPRAIIFERIRQA